MKPKTRNSLYTKQYNRKLILRMIQSQPVSRAEIARQTGLTRAAVTIIVDELIKEGIVKESGTGVAEMGRKPVLLAINAEAFYALGLSLTRDGCALGLVTLGGKTVYKSDIDLFGAENAQKAIDIICESIDSFYKKAQAEDKKILGIGISAPGPINVVNGTIINPPNFKMWNNIDIVSQIGKRFPFKIILNNNSSALALLQKYYADGKNYNDFILLAVDSGVGSAIVQSSKIYRGFGGFASEIGHSSINAMGEQCNCGNYGCLELYASIPQILKEAKKTCGGSISSWEDIVDSAEAGDEKCNEVIAKQARYLSAGIINAVNIFHIENIIITGYISYKSQLLKSYISEIVNSQVMNRESTKINIIISKSHDSDVTAAATIVFDAMIF